MANCITNYIKKNMQQLWSDENLCLKSVYLWCFFYEFTLLFKVFIKIHEYANYIICISDCGVKGMCLSFNLIPSLVVYGK